MPPIGPNGEKRPEDPIAAAVMVMKIATGQIEEEYDRPIRVNNELPKKLRSDSEEDGGQPVDD